VITLPTSDGLGGALAYAQQGWPVFPCGEDKRPLTPHGFKDASTDLQQIQAWWERWPSAMIGVPMGARSGLFCVDLDRKPGGHDGVETWNHLVTIHATPPTLSAVTPSTGQHRYYQYQVGIRSIPLDKLAPGIEIKAEGGYMIVPPSKRNVGSYRWTNGSGITAPPRWLLERIHAHYVRPVTSTPTEPIAPHRISDALDYIDPDIGRAEWFAIGCALYCELRDSGFAVWNNWSSRGSKYNASEMERQWESIAQADGYAYSIGTLFYHAQNAGWVNVRTPEPATPTYSLTNPLSVEAARAKVAEAVRKFLAVIKSNPDHTGYTLHVPTGVGKTVMTAALIAATDFKIFFAVPTHRLGSELAETFAREGVCARIVRGREAKKPGSAIPMCLNLEQVELAIDTGQNVVSTCCKRKEHTCERYYECGYMRQFEDEQPQVWIGAHQLLFHEQK